MGMMDKMKFWKEDDLNLDSELPPLGRTNDDPIMSTNHPEFNPEKSFEPISENPQLQHPSQNPSFNNINQQPTGDIRKDLEVISAKLDAIKSELSSMDQRLRKIEILAEDNPENKKTRASRDPWANY